jgi:hypothetical protein
MPHVVEQRRQKNGIELFFYLIAISIEDAFFQMQQEHACEIGDPQAVRKTCVRCPGKNVRSQSQLGYAAQSLKGLRIDYPLEGSYECRIAPEIHHFINWIRDDFCCLHLKLLDLTATSPMQPL